MKKVLVPVLVLVFFFLVFDVFVFWFAYRLGQGDALSEVVEIMDKQVKSDSTVSAVVIVNPDTNVFILSPKFPRFKDHLGCSRPERRPLRSN